MKLKWMIFFLTLTITLVIIQDIFTKEKPFVVHVYMMNEERAQKMDGVYDGLKSLGYDLNLFKFQSYNAEDSQATFKELLETSFEHPPDVVLSLGGFETMELRKYISKHHLDIPIIFVGIAASSEIGIIPNSQSLEAMSGVSNHQIVLSAKRLELLHLLVPAIHKTIVLYDSRLEVSRLSLEVVMRASQSLGHTIIAHDLATDSTLKNLQMLSLTQAGFLTLPAYTIETNKEKIAAIVKEKNWYSMGMTQSDIENGFLFSYGNSFYDQGFQSARLISQVYQGTSLNELSLELPDTIELIMNEKVNDRLDEFNTDLFPLATFHQEDEGLK